MRCFELHFWIEPAKVTGTWRWSMRAGTRMQAYELVVMYHRSAGQIPRWIYFIL